MTTESEIGFSLSSIAQQDVFVFVAALSVISAVAAIMNYRLHKDLVYAGMFFAHIQSWQMSTIMNMLFWFLLGAGMDNIAAAVLPALFFCADVVKVIVPRQCGYSSSIGKRMSIWFLRVLSIAATIGLGSLFSQQSALDSEVAQLEQKAIQVSIQAANVRLQSNAPDADSLAIQDQLRAKITAIQNRPALTASGNHVYLNGKNTAPSTVWAATQDCKASNRYTKVPKNGCEELDQARSNLTRLTSGLTDQAKNLTSQKKAYDEAKISLKEVKPTLPVNDMIAGLLRFFGVSAVITDDNKLISLFLGGFIAIAFEIIIIITLTPYIDDTGTTPPSPPGKMAKLKFLVRTLRKFGKIAGKSGVRQGSDAGQFRSKSWSNLVKPENGLTNEENGLFEEPAKPTEMGDFKNATLSTVGELVDFNLVGDADGVKLKDGHKQVLVLLMQRYGENAATWHFYKLVKEQYGEGVKKAYIDDAKLILHRNGYMNAMPYGSRGVKYEWVDERTLRTVIRQKRSGVDGQKVVALRPASQAVKPTNTQASTPNRNWSLNLQPA
ncbi:MAG: hypothetical protein PHE17_20165 [Thiothrix sp.]|uniref:hypothetical protein n=1 Tax=Thiothrix sp. TaxID=1032 RepID=UPI00260E3506|nr:hypothetical protein [Thiothrix sp.]MDD5395346.1 hypothetical protein [Thiothrix sp.]